MNEEKYTRDAKKESSRKKRVEPENKTRKKSHADKLKNETSAGESYRKKLRYGKKDNALTVEEAKKLRKMKKQGRKKIYAETAAVDTVRKTGIRNYVDIKLVDVLNLHSASCGNSAAAAPAVIYIAALSNAAIIRLKRILEPPCCFAGGLLSCMPAAGILDGILPQNMAHFNEI